MLSVRVFIIVVSLCLAGLYGIVTGVPVFSAELEDSTHSALPPGQRVITDFPILHYDRIPDLDRNTWVLKITGEVANPVKMDWNTFIQLDTIVSISDFHCVTGWSRLKNRWVGVRIRDVLDRARPKASAKYILFKAADGYSTSLPLSECTGDDDLLAFRWEGRELDASLGGPVRAVIPLKYGYKSAMWLTEMRLTKNEIDGYWEKRGYSRTADPGSNDRYER